MAESNVSQKCTNFDRIQALKFNFGFDLGETWHENLWSFLNEYESIFYMFEKNLVSLYHKTKAMLGIQK